jgi:retron-type reverse transcriptase
MKGREQKIFDESKTSKQKNRTESEGYVGGQTFMWITENNRINNPNATGYDLLEMILSPTNLNLAYQKVKRNKGSAGVDKMEVESLSDYLVQHKGSLIENILNVKYRPNAVRRVRDTERRKEEAKSVYSHGSGQSNPAINIPRIK